MAGMPRIVSIEPLSFVMNNMKKLRRSLTCDECFEMTTLAAESYSQRQFCRRFGVSPTTIGRVLLRYELIYVHTRRSDQNSLRATTTVDDRYIWLMAVHDRHATPRDYCTKIVSKDTIRRRIEKHEHHQ